MANLVAVAGSKIFIGRKVARKANVVISDFTGATWTEIGGWASMGQIGTTHNTVTQSFINEGFDAILKGTRAGNTMDNTFAPDPTDPGQAAFLLAVEDCSNYEFKVEAGAGCAPTGPVTITIASPGVFTVTNGHGLTVGSPVSFATDGALPTGIVAGTTYYVVAAGFTATSFSVAATPGGTAIVTTATQSGNHTYTGLPAGQTYLWRGLAMDGAIAGGDANTTQLRSLPIGINSNVLTI